MSICDKDCAELEVYRFSLWTTYLDCFAYSSRLLMGLSVSLFLYCTRKRRKLPRFVIVQLLLINFDYLLGVMMNSTVVYGAVNQDDTAYPSPIDNSPLQEYYYPIKMVVDVNFVIYNWVYIN